MSETPNEGAGGVSVEGQDERTKRREADELDAVISLEDRFSHLDVPSYAWEVAVEKGYRAALVGSEARERELERTKELLREAQDESQRWADRWARLENRPLIEVAEERATKAEAHQAVLVEALKEATHRMASVAGRMRLRPPPEAAELYDDGDYLAEKLPEFRALVAGVVEAEPAGEHLVRQEPDRSGYGYRATCSCGWTATAASLDGVETAGDVHRAEPDGRER